MSERPLGQFRPPDLRIIVRLFVPGGEPLEVPLDMDPETFRAAMEEAGPDGLVIAEDRESKRWFCPY